MGTKVKVDGIAVYASVHAPNKVSGAYSVDLVVDAKTEAELTAAGLSPARTRTGELVQHNGYEGKVFRFKKKVRDSRGNELTPPGVFDSQGNVVPASVMVGNGSKVRVYANVYSYKVPGGPSGVAGGLNNLQVIELKEYARLDKIEGGYVASAESDDDDAIDVIGPVDPSDII